MHSIRTALRGIIISSLFLIFFGSSNALACSGDGGVIIIGHEPDIIWVIIGRSQTVAGDLQMDACDVAALVDDRIVASIGKPELINPYTLQIVPGLDFHADSRVSDHLERLAPQAGYSWYGFYAEPTDSFQGGIDADIHIEVRLNPGYTAEDFRKMLGKGGKILNGSARKDGSPDFNHINIYHASDTVVYYD
ncbi:MAG: hypothetical protein Tsb002_03470 [Wenzhouxiangellaceae bacterium]